MMKISNKKLGIQEKGITLIALIITIIILLILAGITISILFGEHGILNRAKTSAEQHKIAAAQEEVYLAYNGTILKSYDSSYDSDSPRTYQWKANEMENELKNNDENVTVTVKSDIEGEGYDITNYRTYNFEIINGVISYVGSVDSVDGTGSDETNIPNVADIADIADIVDTNNDLIGESSIIDSETGLFKLPQVEHKTEVPSGWIPIYTGTQFTSIGQGYRETIKDLDENVIGEFDMSAAGNYILMNDINCNGSHIRVKNQFTGNFDGNGYTISNTSANVNQTGSAASSLANASGVGLFYKLHNANVMNLNVDSATIKSNNSVGIIAGLASGNTKISKCSVINSSAISTQRCATGAIVGVATGGSGTTIEIEDCVVRTTSAKTQTGSSMDNAGIIGAYINDSNAGNCTLKRCNVEGFESNSGQIFTSGIIDYFKGDTLTIDGCNVKNLSLYNAGIVGNVDGTLKASNCTYTNSSAICGGMISYAKTSGDSEIKNCKVQEIAISADSGAIAHSFVGQEVSGCTVKNVNCNVAGLINDWSGSNDKILKDCQIQNVSAHNAGMIFHLTGGTTNITNCTVKDLNGITAGIVCDHNGNGLNMSGCKVQNFIGTSGLVQNLSGESSITNCTAKDINGGSVGMVYNYNGSGLTIEGCKAQNVKVTVGFLYQTTSNVTINNCTMNTLTISGGSAQVAGGIAGRLSAGNGITQIISNCKVKDMTVDMTGEHVGSIVGYSSGGSVKDCTVINSDLTLNVTGEDQSIGGIAGWAMASASADNCKVKNSNLKIKKASGASETGSNYIGGILGYGINVVNCNVEGTIIDSTELAQDGTGGITGNAGYDDDRTSAAGTEIKNCNVTSCEIKGNDGVGGICGIAASVIKNCNVSNTKILGNGSNVGGIQGDGGQTVSYRIISNCTLNTCTIKGNSNFDFYEGRISYLNSTTNNEDQITGCTYDASTTKSSI